MADEYIRKQDVVNVIESASFNCFDDYVKALVLVGNIPAADVVPVVRCRDCREFAKTSHWCESFDNPTGEDDFCSYGERREE